MESLKKALLSPDPSSPSPPRIKLGEIGYTGLRVTAKRVAEEANQKLRFPQWVKTVDEMRLDPTVAVALHLYRMMIGRVKWRVAPPIGATAKQIERAKAIESMMHDMEHSWGSFINDVTTYIDYGFAVFEKVYRRRYQKDGSKYDDGLIGWKKLPIRAQSTIKGWRFAPDGRKLVGVEQSLFNLVNMGVISPVMANGGAYVVLPRDKVLLFSADARNGNPEGSSPLKSAYLAYQYKKAVMEQEMVGLARDLGGIINIGIPARYMSPDASPEEKALYDYYMNVARNAQAGQQSGFVTPSDVDPEAKQKLFTIDLLQSQGGKAYDTNEIIKRFDSQILISLYADLLQMGNNAIGSFALMISALVERFTKQMYLIQGKSLLRGLS